MTNEKAPQTGGNDLGGPDSNETNFTGNSSESTASDYPSGYTPYFIRLIESRQKYVEEFGLEKYEELEELELEQHKAREESKRAKLERAKGVKEDAPQKKPGVLLSPMELSERKYQIRLNREANRQIEEEDNGTTDQGGLWDVQDIIARGRPDHRKPTILPVQGDDEHRCLFYPGKINWVFGDKSAGKSMLMRAAQHEVIETGKHVVHLEFDANTAEDVIWDLVDAGAKPEAVVQYFHGMSLPRDLGVLEGLGDLDIGLVTLDAVNPAITFMGKEHNSDGSGVDTAIQRYMTPLVSKGACGLVIDHVGHADKGRPNHSIRKEQAVRGAMFLLENVEPGRVGTEWHSKLTLKKDNNGRGFTVDETVGYMVVDGTAGSGDAYNVQVVRHLPLHLMAAATDELNEVYDALVGLGEGWHSSNDIREALGWEKTSANSRRIRRLLDRHLDIAADGQRGNKRWRAQT